MESLYQSLSEKVPRESQKWIITGFEKFIVPNIDVYDLESLTEHLHQFIVMLVKMFARVGSNKVSGVLFDDNRIVTVLVFYYNTARNITVLNKDFAQMSLLRNLEYQSSLTDYEKILSYSSDTIKEFGRVSQFGERLYFEDTGNYDEAREWLRNAIKRILFESPFLLVTSMLFIDDNNTIFDDAMKDGISIFHFLSFEDLLQIWLSRVVFDLNSFFNDRSKEMVDIDHFLRIPEIVRIMKNMPIFSNGNVRNLIQFLQFLKSTYFHNLDITTDYPTDLLSIDDWLDLHLPQYAGNSRVKLDKVKKAVKLLKSKKMVNQIFQFDILRSKLNQRDKQCLLFLAKVIRLWLWSQYSQHIVNTWIDDVNYEDWMSRYLSIFKISPLKKRLHFDAFRRSFKSIRSWGQNNRFMEDFEKFSSLFQEPNQLVNFIDLLLSTKLSVWKRLETSRTILNKQDVINELASRMLVTREPIRLEYMLTPESSPSDVTVLRAGVIKLSETPPYDQFFRWFHNGVEIASGWNKKTLEVVIKQNNGGSYHVEVCDDVAKAVVNDRYNWQESAQLDISIFGKCVRSGVIYNVDWDETSRVIWKTMPVTQFDFEYRGRGFDYNLQELVKCFNLRLRLRDLRLDGVREAKIFDSYMTLSNGQHRLIDRAFKEFQSSRKLDLFEMPFSFIICMLNNIFYIIPFTDQLEIGMREMKWGDWQMEVLRYYLRMHSVIVNTRIGLMEKQRMRRGGRYQQASEMALTPLTFHEIIANKSLWSTIEAESDDRLMEFKHPAIGNIIPPANEWTWSGRRSIVNYGPDRPALFDWIIQYSKYNPQNPPPDDYEFTSLEMAIGSQRIDIDIDYLSFINQIKMFADGGYIIQMSDLRKVARVQACLCYALTRDADTVGQISYESITGDEDQYKVALIDESRFLLLMHATPRSKFRVFRGDYVISFNQTIDDVILSFDEHIDLLLDFLL